MRRQDRQGGRKGDREEGKLRRLLESEVGIAIDKGVGRWKERGER